MDDLTKALVCLAAAFPRDRVPDSTLTLYHTKLKGAHVPTMIQAIEDCIDSSRAFPSLAEIRENYVSHRRRVAAEIPALPEGGGVPMPEEIRRRVNGLLNRMDERAEELEPS